jgi:hypothetical protein
MTNYKVMIDNDIAGVGLGGTVSETDLEGWDLPHLLKIGALEEISVSPTPTKVKEVQE